MGRIRFNKYGICTLDIDGLAHILGVAAVLYVLPDIVLLIFSWVGFPFQPVWPSSLIELMTTLPQTVFLAFRWLFRWAAIIAVGLVVLTVPLSFFRKETPCDS